MRVAVIGGTGEVGSLVVAELAARGDAVRAISRRAPEAGTLPPGVEHARADVASGDGLRRHSQGSTSSSTPRTTAVAPARCS